MKLSFNSNAYIRYPIEVAIERVAKLGYEGIEIARTHPLHELGKQDREKVLRMIKSYGLEVSSTQGGIPCLDTEFAKERIDLAADLQCPVVNIGPGVDVIEEKERERYWKQVVEGFRELAEYGKNKGVTVAMEAEPPGNPVSGRVGRVYPRLIQTLEDMRRMLADVNAENLGILLDIGHMYVVRENVPHVIEKLREKIVHVHVEDIVDRIHCHFIPGTGMVDFEATIRALARVGYQGFLSLEIEMHSEDPDRAARESIQYMDSLLYRIGLK